MILPISCVVVTSVTASKIPAWNPGMAMDICTHGQETSDKEIPKKKNEILQSGSRPGILRPGL